MSFRVYRMIKFVIILVLVALTTVAVNYGIAWIPIPSGLVAVIAMLLAKRQVKEVVVDERNYTIANRASRFTFQAGAIIMAFIGVTLEALRRNGCPELEPYALTLILSTAGLFIIYIFSTLYHSGKLGGGVEE
jgi:uncharacterized membrane protein